MLFLFVVMMLNIDFTRLREGFQRYAPLGAIVGGILFLELVLVLGAWTFAGNAEQMRMSPAPADGVSNAEALGRILYTDYVYLFQAAGLILLVAMIGAIVLTLRERPGTRRQDIAAQIARANTVALREVPSGAGLARLGIERPVPEEEERPAAAAIAHGGHGHGGHH